MAARETHAQPDTNEIARLAERAGYDVVGELTQRRHEDRGTWLGPGKADELTALVTETEADAVIVDGGLDPGQYTDLLDTLPPGTELFDRYRLILGIFAAGAGDKRAALQIEAATLRYELPRLRRLVEVSALSRAVEKGNPVLDAERRLDSVEGKLDELAVKAAERRENRRAAGFDLVALAGYTNAGKTTLLHRLAEDLSLDGEAHPDLADSAPVDDDLFVTLETLTRRGTVGERDVLYTDTVGLIDELPHDLVASFSATLDETAAADVALLIVDASDDPDRVREKVRVSLDELGAIEGKLICVLNKADAVADIQSRREAVADLVPDVLTVSAIDGSGIDALQERIERALPTETATFELPNDDSTQRFLAWAYDHGAVETEYGGTVTVRFEARPEMVEQARGRVTEL